MSHLSSTHTNNLIHESSPYLLQHAHNPVDWNAWNPETLKKAAEQDKPILLSIGYSSCHWCHVMEQESFENQKIAQHMNEGFINIKVDREERPDVDSIYMNFVQMTTGSGGWPLTVFLTPDLVPFYGGTYFPPEDRHGHPGFLRILQSVREAFVERRPEIEANRNRTLERLEKASEWVLTPGDLSKNVLDQAYQQCVHQFDNHHGGFGQPPKFPSSMALTFLLRYSKRINSSTARHLVDLSLEKMATGGIYDQLGGGFHRYSVDEQWLVPHFEKMLYDNALLARVYLEAYQVSKNNFYKKIVHETLGYVQRELLDSQGGFYSSQDADTEGMEGRFYAWTPQDVRSVLDQKTADIFCEYYDVTSSGNFEESNVLHPQLENVPYAKRLGITVEELEQLMDQARQQLFQARENRVRPGLDDKILASWNGLMLSTFAEAAFAFNCSDYLETSLRNADFLYSQMLIDGRLCRSWKEGQARLNGYLDDYAQVIEGWLTVYQASGDPIWLDRAAQLMETQLALFWNEDQVNFHFTSFDHEQLVIRHKEYMDNATPSGNAVSCLNLLRLSKLLGLPDYQEKAERMLKGVSRALERHPLAFGFWLQALDHFLGPVYEVAIVGPEKGRACLLQAVREQHLPNILLAVSEKDANDLSIMIPLLKGKTAIDGRATAYVCQNYSCQSPVLTTEELKKVLGTLN